MTGYNDLHRIRMARRKHRGESAFLTMNRIQPRRIRLNFWGTLAIEVAVILAADMTLSLFGFGSGFLKRADPKSEQIEPDGATPPQPVELPTPQVL